jgi:hypothetical protein
MERREFIRQRKSATRNSRNNPGINRIESAQYSDGIIRVKGRFAVNSTGWSVSHATTTNDEGKIAGIQITPTPPPRGVMVGWGFPSDGQEFEEEITGDFARIVSVTLMAAKLPLHEVSIEIPCTDE